MNIHEYQAKTILKNAGIPVPQGKIAFNVADALNAAKNLEYPIAIKAQVHTGGRGKAGGIKIVSDIEATKIAAESILGMIIKTTQTTEGKKVSKILIEQGVEISQELYLSIIPDRDTAKIMIIASKAGGINIEEFAKKHPEEIIKIFINPLLGIKSYHIRQIAFNLELNNELYKDFSDILSNLYKLVVDNDLTLCEINPLVLTKDNNFVALDAKIEIDSNALYRHRELGNLYDSEEADPLEAKAAKYNLNYVRLNGNIGTMVNGAGLAMATMDIIKSAGAHPANFMDVGGGATSETIENGFEILLNDPTVEAIFINIFGGILRCDLLAKGVIKAAHKVGVSIPVIVRLEGTNAKIGRKILAESNMNFKTAINLNDATEKITESVG